MSDNPNFNPTYSTWDIWRAGEMEQCLDDDLATIEANIASLQSGKSDTNHTHTGYVTESDLTVIQSTINSKADATHTHTEYALSSHTHDGYATVNALDALESEVNGKADSSHTHTEYATTTALNEVSGAISNKANISHNHNDVYYTESEIDSKLNSKSDSTHTHTGVYDVSGAAASALTSANAYTDSKIDALVGSGASTTLDTIGEISNAIENNQDAIDTLNEAIANKANATDLSSHISNTTVHISANERNNWNSAKTHADTAHAPSNAEVNQNAFSNVTIGNTTITADTKTDTLTIIAGNNVTLTPNEESDSITIASTDTVYIHPSTAGNKHIPSGGSSGQILRWSADGTAVWGADNNTTYSTATQSVAGLMSADDKTKLDGIANGSNNYVLPSAGASLGGVKTGGDVTISNGVITVNDDSHNHVIANIDGLQNALDSKASSSHNHNSSYYTQSQVDAKDSATLASAKTYADGVKNDLLNGAGDAYDTLKELGDLIDTNTDAIEALETVATSKANASDLTTHVSNKSNPHDVTLSQLGVTATASELNIMDGVIATTAEINYLDGVTSNIQTQLDGKASSSHGTHVSYGTTAPKANGTASVGTATTVSRSDHVHPVQTTVSGNAGTATKLATARTISLTGDVTGSASFDGSANASITATVADDSHNHVISNVDGLQTALNGKATTNHTHTNYANVSHKHYPTNISATGKNLNNYTDAGIYTFTDGAAPANVPAGTNGWLVVIPWIEDSNTVKQIWFRHGTVNTNDFETYVRTKVGTASWGSWSKYYTTSNPPTYAEVGASPAFTSSNGDVKISISTSDNKNLLDKIDELSTGVYTIYSQSGVSGNPKSTEAWRLLVHKTSATVGWVMAFGSSGSVYSNYQNEADHFQGWRCIYDATNSNILWTGAYYMSSPNNTPQTVTPSKKLSECRTGWLLLWSDYDANTSTANDTDFCTTYIPKYNPSGGTWSGKAFYCDVPMYAGGDETDLSTEKRCIKLVYVYDNCIKGNYQNNQGGRNDVVLRAVYEV